MLLKDILKTKGHQVWTIQTGQTVAEAVAVLVDNKIGALLAMETDGKIGGILSERDVMRMLPNHGAAWNKVLVRDVMTPRIIIGTPEDPVDYVMGIMTQNRIRHLPVMDHQKLVGVVSIGDIVKAQLNDTQYENQYLKEYLSGS